MKKNLSTEALKGFKKEPPNTTPMKRRNTDATGTPPNTAVQVLNLYFQSALKPQKAFSLRYKNKILKYFLIVILLGYTEYGSGCTGHSISYQ